MSYNLGNNVYTKKLTVEQLGTADHPVDNAYITNIIPPPGSGPTPTLQQVCDTGNSTTTGLNVDGDYSSVNGDIVTTNGNIDATAGIVSADSMVAATEYFSVNGNFRTINGRVVAPQINANQSTDTLHIVGKVGIGVNPADPITEDLEVDGNIQIDTSGLGKIVFYDNVAGHEHGEYDADDDGTNGGQLIFKTKADGGSVATRMVIREDGKVGINTPAPSETLEVSGTAKATNVECETGQIAYFYRRIPLTYLTDSVTGTGALLSSTVMTVNDWLISLNIRSTGSVTSSTWRITKPLPSGAATFGNCRIQTDYSNSGTTGYIGNITVYDSALSSDVTVRVDFPTALPSGVSANLWVEFIQLLN